MSRCIVRSGIVVACLSVIVFLPQSLFAQAPKVKSELEGAWRIVRWQGEDVDKMPEQLKKECLALRVAVMSNEMAWINGQIIEVKTFSVGAGNPHKTIDFMCEVKRPAVRGANHGSPEPYYRQIYKDKYPETYRLMGIYKLEGDRLTIALIDQRVAKGRATDFNVRPESRTIVFTVVRVQYQ